MSSPVPYPRGEHFFGMLGHSPVMRELFRQLQILSTLESTVCLEGEAGVGKKLAARILHRISSRSEAPCLTLNTAELPPALFEAHFFGHGEEAFAGLLGSREGLVSQAEGGTLVLEEVTELAESDQRLVYRFLEDRRIRPVCEPPRGPVDVRLVCTSSRDISGEVSAGRFDRNLYLALRVFTVRVPALREHLEDLPVLVQHFLTESVRSRAKQVEGLSPEAEALLAAYSWPGNVAELKEEIDRGVILTPAGGRIAPEVLSEKVRRAGEPPSGERDGGADV